MVATEVGKLAERVNLATGDIVRHTTEILDLVSSTRSQTNDIHLDLSTSEKVVSSFTQQFDQFVTDFDRMDGQMGQMAGNVAQVNATNQEMSHAIAHIAELSAQVQNRMVTMSDQVQAVRGKTESLQAQLSTLRTGDTPYDWLANTLRSMRSACVKMLDQAKRQNIDIFDCQYQRIAGSDPARFQTRYDGAIEQPLQLLLDYVLSQVPAGYYSVLLDKNGYCPTHNSRYSKSPTGDPVHDNVHVRHKRIFDDDFSLAAVRNERGVLCQTHMRDTGEIITDVSLPLDIDGVRWGAVRIGVDYSNFEKGLSAAN